MSWSAWLSGSGVWDISEWNLVDVVPRRSFACLVALDRDVFSVHRHERTPHTPRSCTGAASQLLRGDLGI